MIEEIGVDLININRLKRLVEDRGEKFLDKVFTPYEIEYINKKNRNPQTIGGLFAGKEAVSKVLGTGIGRVNWKDIEINHMNSGKPYIILYREGKKTLDDLGLKDILISISHERDYAIAFAQGRGV